MRCDYFDAGRCRSCTRLSIPYPDQVAAKQAAAQALLPSPRLGWLPPHPSPEAHFRARAKMVVGGSVSAPTLGILDEARRGVDLRACPLLGPATTQAMPVLAAFITQAGLRPYDVAARSGELKYVHVTESPAGELAVRFVLRSSGQVERLRRHLPALMAELDAVRVVSVNLLPEHKAVTEGATEIPLTDATTLALQVNDVTLHLQPGAFVQTNTAVAEALYARARGWVDEVAPSSVLDLYCGVGGFALHAAAPGRAVLGVEVSEPAVASARRSADEAGLDVTFGVGDATAVARVAADLVIVNPPRRGLGAELTAVLDDCGAGTLLYSSCNPTTLARDLARLTCWRVERAQLFDMFPHTDHAEVLVHLTRRGARPPAARR